MISLDEFVESTKKTEFLKNEGWEVCMLNVNCLIRIYYIYNILIRIFHILNELHPLGII